MLTTRRVDGGYDVKLPAWFLKIVSQRKKNSKSARPASTIGFLHPPTPDATGAMTSRSTALMEDEDEGAPKPPDWLVDWEKNQGTKEPLWVCLFCSSSWQYLFTMIDLCWLIHSLEVIATRRLTEQVMEDFKMLVCDI